jgi:hypothetical protein
VGLVGFAALTDFEVLTQPALVLCAAITVAGTVGQLAGPVVAGRAAGGTAGAATGAALGAVLGSLVPVPGASWIGAVLGATVLGVGLGREALVGWVRGVVGTAGGCAVGVVADAVAVLALGAVLGVSDFLHEVQHAGGV